MTGRAGTGRRGSQNRRPCVRFVVDGTILAGMAGREGTRCLPLLPFVPFPCRGDVFVCRGDSRALWTFGRRPPSRPAVLSAAGCSDGLTVVATLAHELCWTRVCRQDPRRSAADRRRPRPINRAAVTRRAVDWCLRAATRATGSGASHTAASPRMPPGHAAAAA